MLGPLLLLFLALLLVFVVFHTVEHGVEGLLFSCAVLAAVTLRLVVVVGRIWRVRLEQPLLAGRSPPWRAAVLLRAIRPPVLLFALPLRR